MRIIVLGIARTARGLSPFVISARLATIIIQPKIATGMAAVAVTVSRVSSIAKRTPLELPSRLAVEGNDLTRKQTRRDAPCVTETDFVLLVEIV